MHYNFLQHFGQIYMSDKFLFSPKNFSQSFPTFKSVFNDGNKHKIMCTIEKKFITQKRKSSLLCKCCHPLFKTCSPFWWGKKDFQIIFFWVKAKTTLLPKLYDQDDVPNFGSTYYIVWKIYILHIQQCYIHRQMVSKLHTTWLNRIILFQLHIDIIQ